MHHFTPAGDSHPKPGGSALAWDVHVLSSNYESVGAAPTLGVPNDAPDRRRRDAAGRARTMHLFRPLGAAPDSLSVARAGCAAQRPEPNGLGSHWPFANQMPSGRGGSDAAAQGAN